MHDVLVWKEHFSFTLNINSNIFEFSVLTYVYIVPKFKYDKYTSSFVLLGKDL